jgi:hypothetical protein
MLIQRRALLTGLFAAPAIIAIDRLMPVSTKQFIFPDPKTLKMREFVFTHHWEEYYVVFNEHDGKIMSIKKVKEGRFSSLQETPSVSRTTAT